MAIKVGTFNLNNLFSRYNFQAEVDSIKKADATVSETVRYEFTDDDMYRLRTFKGRLVKGKSKATREAIAARIKKMNCDVLAVQEVENIDILKTFNHDDLGRRYKHYVLVEGNDPRLIDVAVLSKLPIGAVTSWQQLPHPAVPSRPIFGRDLLQIDIWDKARSTRLFTLFNTHLKSHFGDDDNAGKGKKKNDLKRTREAEVVRDVLRAQMGEGAAYVVVGDMNDPPESPCLAPFVDGLVNGLAHATETRPAKADHPDAPSPVWTHRYVRDGVAEHLLFDQIWLSPPLADRLGAAKIDRRTKHGGDGSDHDPAWIELDL